MAQPARKLNESDLNAASILLIQQLPEHISQLMFTLRDENNIELWHLVCGVLLEVYSTGQMSAFQIDPQWLDGLKQTTLVCKECKKIFTPVNINQPYCTNECGLKALTEVSSKEASPKEVKNDQSVAQPKSDPPQPIHIPAAGSIDSGWTDILEEIK